MKIEVATGEIVDKLSILHIKKEHISDPEKLSNVTNEYIYLHDIVFGELKIFQYDYIALKTVNELLWEIEDEIRIKEARGEFDEYFIELARKVYKTNDRRAAIKKDINLKYGSQFIEEKSYEKY
jgi:hypothetical protein